MSDSSFNSSSRRRFLTTCGTAFVTGLAGCAESTTPDTTTHQSATTSITTTTTAHTTSPTEQESTTTREAQSVYHVSPDGKRSNDGTVENPFGSVQRALKEAMPGDEVRVAPGEYRDFFKTVRSGEPGAPITITGPASAIRRRIAVINHSHIHLRGMTFNGLKNPDAPEDPSSYEVVLVHCQPPEDSETYLEDIVCAPAGIGNSRRPQMLFERTKNLEIGPLEVIGMAGAEFILDQESQAQAGEIIYLGQPTGTVERDSYPWETLDQTRNVHVHHIDNSAGHPHSELVNTKLGTRDVLVEYCTSHGGSQNNSSRSPPAEVRFESQDATLRWCDLRDGTGYGVQVVAQQDWLEQRDDPVMAPEQAGINHSIYENRITGFAENAIMLNEASEKQGRICGNMIPTASNSHHTEPCDASTPDGDGIGTTGGDNAE